MKRKPSFWFLSVRRSCLPPLALFLCGFICNLLETVIIAIIIVRTILFHAHFCLFVYTFFISFLSNFALLICYKTIDNSANAWYKNNDIVIASTLYSFWFLLLDLLYFTKVNFTLLYSTPLYTWLDSLLYFTLRCLKCERAMLRCPITIGESMWCLFWLIFMANHNSSMLRKSRLCWTNVRYILVFLKMLTICLNLNGLL